MKIFDQKIIFHRSKRVQHKMSIWFHIKTITEKQSVQSLFIFRASSFISNPIPASRTIQRGRCSAKEIGINRNGSLCSLLSQLVFGLPLPYARKNKSKQDILPADDFIVKGIANSCKMYVSSACSQCRCIHTFSHIMFSFFFFGTVIGIDVPMVRIPCASKF